MNYFNFSITEAIEGLFNVFMLGLLLGGGIFGLFRFLFLTVFERKEA